MNLNSFTVTQTLDTVIVYKYILNISKIYSHQHVTVHIGYGMIDFCLLFISLIFNLLGFGL